MSAYCQRRLHHVDFPTGELGWINSPHLLVYGIFLYVCIRVFSSSCNLNVPFPEAHSYGKIFIHCVSEVVCRRTDCPTHPNAAGGLYGVCCSLPPVDVMNLSTRMSSTFCWSLHFLCVCMSNFFFCFWRKEKSRKLLLLKYFMQPGPWAGIYSDAGLCWLESMLWDVSVILVTTVYKL